MAMRLAKFLTDLAKVAAQREDGLRDAVQKTWRRGGVIGFYQGLIPWVS